MKAVLNFAFYGLMALSTSSHAAVLRETFESAALGVQKAYRVYLPESYNGTRRYPVIYLLHGWGITENYWADNMGLAQTADAMKLQAIVVMPDGDRSFYANSSASVDFNACVADTALKVTNRSDAKNSVCARQCTRITSFRI